MIRVIVIVINAAEAYVWRYETDVVSTNETNVVSTMVKIGSILLFILMYLVHTKGKVLGKVANNYFLNISSFHSNHSLSWGD